MYGPGIADWYPAPTFMTHKLNGTYFFMYKNFETQDSEQTIQPIYLNETVFYR